MGILLTVCVLFILFMVWGAIATKKDEKLRAGFLIKLDESFNNRQITEAQYEDFKKRAQQKGIVIEPLTRHLQDVVVKNALAEKKKKELVNKYGEAVAVKILEGFHWIGMTKEMVLDLRGNPTKYESEQLKTKYKETLIYGTKSSGDYYVLEDGLVSKIVDR